MVEFFVSVEELRTLKLFLMACSMIPATHTEQRHHFSRYTLSGLCFYVVRLWISIRLFFSLSLNHSITFPSLGWQIYYSGQTYYALEASKEIDNPDQRIAEDVRAFTQVSLEFLITVLTSCIDLASFSTILYS